jgi:uncharacterized OB-fold protein
MEQQKTYRSEHVIEKRCQRCGKKFLPTPIGGKENPNRDICLSCLTAQ